MSYATADELAAELRIVVSPANEAKLQACVDAAAAEIDHAVDWTPQVQPLSEPPGPLLPAEQMALLNRVNLVRAVEWFKSNDAAFGVIGFQETGILQAPRDAFIRHARALIPVKQRFGIA